MRAFPTALIVQPTVVALLIWPIVSCPAARAGATSDNASALAEQQEPPERFELSIGDVKIGLELGVLRKVQVGNELKSIQLQKAAVRTLQVRHVSFDYPSHFYFTAEVNASVDGFSKWDLKGRWVKVSLQRLTNDVSFADYVAQMKDELTSKDGTRQVTNSEGIAKQFGGDRVPGIRFDVMVAPDAGIIVEYFDLLELDECRYVLVMAYSPGEGDEEAELVRTLLQDTLKAKTTTNTRKINQ
ncbi:MAG TPA: hypothetical protein VHK01_19045 [Lacipirellulaceae bacterium]|jgi:hypothetical protein|nr:hypothetical protein [Lacipirellulaceae bacterium]